MNPLQPLACHKREKIVPELVRRGTRWPVLPAVDLRTAGFATVLFPSLNTAEIPYL
jgi:hypothetical protein